MSSTVRVRSALEKPFPQRRRSTGQLQGAVQPQLDVQAENIRRGSGELSGDNLRTIHENSPASQRKNPVTASKDGARIHRRTSGVGSRASFDVRHKQYRSSWGFDSTDSAVVVDTTVSASTLSDTTMSASTLQDVRNSREKSRSTFTLYSESFSEANTPHERSAVGRSRSTVTLLGGDRFGQLAYDSPGRPYPRTASRRSLQLPDFNREARRVPEVAEDVSYLDGIERETTIEEELERDVVKLEAYLCIWRERYMRARTTNACLRKTVKDLRCSHEQRVFLLNEKLFALTDENYQLSRRNAELVAACSLVLDRNKQERRRHEQQMRDVTREVKRMRTQCKEAEDKLSAFQAAQDARAAGGSEPVNGANDLDMCYQTLLEIALARIKFLEQEDERVPAEEHRDRQTERATIVATECKKITRSISAMIQSDNEDDDAEEMKTQSLPAVVMRSFRSSRRSRRAVSTLAMSSSRTTLAVPGSPDVSTKRGADEGRPQFSLSEDVDDSTSVNSVDSVLSSLITRLQETAAAATDTSDRLSTSGRSPEFAFRRCHSVTERGTEATTTDADSVSMAAFRDRETPPTGRQTSEPEADAAGHSASGFAVLRQRRNGIVNIKFPTDSKQKKGKAREITDAIRRFTTNAKSRECDKKRTSIQSVFKTLSS